MLKLVLTFIHILLIGSIGLTPSAIAQNETLPKGQALFAAHLQKLHHHAPTINSEVLKLAMNAFEHAYLEGHVKKPYLTIIDYSLPSSEKRMWVFDIEHDKLLFQTHVAHGVGSGSLFATHFSNLPQSKESSLGTYVTEQTYFGGKGYSLNLQGLEIGYNSNAYRRRVVMHGAWYVEPNFIKSQGRAGRSWGCPAISTKLARPIINAIKGGSILFAYYPDKAYLNHSNYVHA